MSDSPFRPALEFALQSALEHLEGLDMNPVGATATLQELRSRLVKPLPCESLGPEQVLRELVEDTRGGIIGSAGGRFFAWAVGGALPAALGADWLTSAWDQNAALYACGPAAAIVEEVACGWLKELLGLPHAASVGLVSGCQMAHVTCLAAARHELLGRCGWDVERRGMAGSPPIRVLASNRHGSIQRAVRFLGIGDDQVVDLALDERETLRPETLEASLQKADGSPVIVVLQAGDLNTGSFDPYRELIPMAKRYGSWVHIDGAFGLWAAVSPRYRHLLDGVEAADSWSTDGHKWLNVPYDCGYAIVAKPSAHRAAMSHRAPYLVHDAEARDQMDWNPEWSRRGRGFATYAALRQLGREGIAGLIDRCCEAAAAIVEGIGRLPGVEVLWRPVINQGLVRFLDPADNGHDGYTDLIVERISSHGGAFFKATTWRGMRAMRVSVMNWQTNQLDVERTIKTVAQCLNQSKKLGTARMFPN
jgi:glutamate/tyrosine decarboxylase-like PLP-dependent enzyme